MLGMLSLNKVVLIVPVSLTPESERRPLHLLILVILASYLRRI